MTTMPKGINWNEQFYKLLRLSLGLTQEFPVEVDADGWRRHGVLPSCYVGQPRALATRLWRSSTALTYPSATATQRQRTSTEATEGCYAPPDIKSGAWGSTLKGSPRLADGTLFQSAFRCHHTSAGPSDAAVTERRRFQRLGPCPNHCLHILRHLSPHVEMK